MKSRRIRALSTVGLLVGAALAFSPVVAHADGWRTVTATGEGNSGTAALANSEASARIKLTSQAMQAGQMCSSVTSSSELTFISPYGNYVAQGTATGYCAVTPPYVVFRGFTQQASGTSGSAALAQADAQARALVLAFGINCTNWLSGSRLVGASGSLVVMEATEWALCTN